MRLNRLQALRAVLELGSVTEASRRIHRTQPQVSRLISSLEDEVGFKLFNRDGRGLVPTEQCLKFYESTRHVIAGFDEIDRIAESIRSQQEAWLRIVTQPYLASSVVPKAIAVFSRRHPNVRVTIDVRSRIDVGLWMTGQNFDLGVAALPIDFPGLRTQNFADVRVIVAVPESHRLATKRKITVADLDGEVFIALRPFTLLRNSLDELIKTAHLNVRIVIETSSGQSACQLVAEGLGITLSDPLVAAEVRGIKLLDLEPAMSIPYGFLVPANSMPSPLAREFAQIFIEAINQFAGKRVSKPSQERRGMLGDDTFP